MVFGLKLPSPPTIPKLVSNIKPNLINVASSNKLPLVAKALSMVTPVGAAVAVAGLVIQNKDVIKTTLASAAVKVESTVKTGASTLEKGVVKVGSAAVSGFENMLYSGGALVVLILLLK